MDPLGDEGEVQEEMARLSAVFKKNSREVVSAEVFAEWIAEVGWPSTRSTLDGAQCTPVQERRLCHSRAQVYEGGRSFELQAVYPWMCQS